ncbi:MAG: glycosyltransferase [Chlamydiae bacterium]|nr:glycosyltransferase [Chlamydiota bacterium]MBI3276213.1 glycosyltransferase [Chlamydiota bacterium]
MVQPTVSVIMNAYNAERFLREAIESVYVQTFKDWEIIFWDNASTDGTAEIAKSYNDRFRYFKGEVNVPLGQARHLAIIQTKGEYLAFLDCDDLWVPKKLEKQLKLFHLNSKLGLVYSDGYTINERGEILLRYSHKHKIYRGNIFDQLLMSCFIPPVGAMIPRAVYDRVGPFQNFRTAEEYDLFLKIAYQYPCDYVEEPLYKYRSHDGNLSLTGSREYLHRESIEIREYWVKEVSENGSPKTYNKLVRKLLVREYVAFCRWFLDQGRNEEARKYILLSLRLKPFQLGFLHCFLLSICPHCLSIPLLKGIRYLKNHLRSS